jgi:hypothetical protein
MTDSTLRAALAFAQTGWAVLPVAANGKRPLSRHGVRDASVEEPQIRRWWLRWPDANVGIATGAPSGLVVVDVDLERGGAESLQILTCAGRELPPSLRAETGGGGFHLFYRRPAGLVVPNTAGRLPNVAEPLPGIDLRGDGGYVVAPPSVHASGRPYRWSSEGTRDLAPMPRWLWPRPPSPVITVVAGRRTAGASPYGHAALVQEICAVRRLVVGQRNDGLNRAAFCLGTLVAGGELAEDLVFTELLAAAISVGLDEREAQATIRSGLDAGATTPRRAPAASFGR